MGKVQKTLLEQLHSSCITAPFPNVFNSVAQPEKLTYIKNHLKKAQCIAKVLGTTTAAGWV